uniref:Leucine rich adaptor protein 1 n=1 Tax=Echeneis naucrates TaxID=173247 RepID=A0A665UZC1_ECHNA
LEEFTFDFPELREVEAKVGRKTPESLLAWMRDAADCGDGWRPDVGGDSVSALSFSDKISSLKQEMRWLHSADVRILRQLVAVHEGIEAMRWLMEERGALLSRGSSLTGSLSSLYFECYSHRESLSPACPHTDDGDSSHESYFDMLSTQSTEARPSSPSSCRDRASTRGAQGLALSNPANGLVHANLQKSQPEDMGTGPLEDIKAGTIKRALLRSSRPRKKVDACSFINMDESEQRHRERSLPQDSFQDSQDKMLGDEDSAPSSETFLLGYDAQWCWVESQDDVTFL